MAGTYCSVADVQGEFRSLVFSASTTPTTGQVTAWIAQAGVEIESKVGMKYQVPIPNPSDGYTLLQQISISLVAGRVRNVLPVKAGGADGETGGKGRPGDASIAWARGELKKIATGDTALVGASLVSSDDGVQVGISQAVDGTVGGQAELQQAQAPYHIFRRDEDQW